MRYKKAAVGRLDIYALWRGFGCSVKANQGCRRLLATNQNGLTIARECNAFRLRQPRQYQMHEWSESVAVLIWHVEKRDLLIVQQSDKPAIGTEVCTGNLRAISAIVTFGIHGGCIWLLNSFKVSYQLWMGAIAGFDGQREQLGGNPFFGYQIK